MATLDDVIQMYETSSREWSNTSLWHESQKGVSCIAWEPLSAHNLAIGCEQGVVLWRRPGVADRAQGMTGLKPELLSNSRHFPVVTIAWAPNGRHLVTGSPNDPALYVWDAAAGESMRVVRGRYGGTGQVLWSPDGHFVYQSTVGELAGSYVMRLWNTEDWNCDQWSSPTGRYKTAVWSNDGTALLFGIEGQSQIYALIKRLSSVLSIWPDDAIILTDATPRGMERRPLQQLAWCPQSMRLVATFAASHNNGIISDPIFAVYHTSTSPSFRLAPSGFARPREGFVDSSHADADDDGENHRQRLCIEAVQFAQHCRQAAILSIAYNDNTISLFPFIFPHQ